MKLDNNSVPVVILKFHHGSLGIARSLGRLGVPVYGIHPQASDPTLATKYCKETLIWDIEKQPVAQSLEFLADLGRKIGRTSILISTSDATTIFVSENTNALSEHFIFPYQPLQLVNSLADKKLMYHLALKHNIPAPGALFPRSKEELMEHLNTVQFPVMFKGIDGTKLKMHDKPKMLKVDTKDELLAAYAKWEDPAEPNFMLQEFIPGGEDSVWMFNGYFDQNSNCQIGITGKKLRQYPAYKGATSLGICVQNDEVDQTTRRFMKAIGYQGILDIGYRYDARDGLYKVLDINPRIGSSFRLFVGTNGMDVARALYLSLTNQPVPETAIHEGRKWLVENQDLSSCLVYRRDGKLTFGEFVGSFKGVKEATWFATDDMKPFFKLCNFYLKKSLGWSSNGKNGHHI